LTPSVELGDDQLQHLRVIGAGGFATVYAAWDAPFQRWVAVKVLHSLDEGGRRRFDRERELVGQLSGHPRVVTPYRFGHTRGGAPYLVMEYLDGGSLEALLSERIRLGWAEAISYATAVGEALEHAHGRGVLHRDVKPANVLLASTGAKLGDFGIAALKESTSTQLAFTLAHCPPEAFSGGFDRRDERSDIYSLASTLYTLITGRAPFQVDGADSQPAYLTRITNHPVPPIDATLAPEPLAAVILQALAKDPTDRPATATDFVAGLRHASNADLLRHQPRQQPASQPTQPATVPPDVLPTTRSSEPRGGGVSVVPTPGRRPRRGAWPLIVGVAVLAGAALAGAVLATMWWLQRPEPISGACRQAAVDKIECSGHTGQIQSLAALGDGRFASTSRDGTIRVWNPAKLDDPAVGFSAGARLNAVAALPDGRLVFGGEDQITHLWDPGTSTGPEALAKHSGSVQAIAVVGQQEIAVGVGSIEVLNLDGLPIETLDTTDQGGVIDLASLDGNRLAYSGNNDLGVVVIWDRSAHETMAVRPRPTKDISNQVIALASLGGGRFVSSHRLSPGDTDSGLWVWQTSPEDRLEFTGHHYPVEALAVTADRRVVSSGGDDGQVLIWNPDAISSTPTLLATETSPVTAIAVLSDNRIAVGLLDGRIVIHTRKPS
jgi:Protein kinase domain/WD domain, G-beta repeat